MTRKSASPFFRYGKREIAHLQMRDPGLGAYILARGKLERPLWPDPFLGLAHAIVGQQISGRVQNAIWQKLLAAYPAPEPAQVASGGIEVLRQCGISARKSETILRLAEAFACDALNCKKLARMTDAELVHTLTAYKGIGPWTVEMLMIFTFSRPDVFSPRDLGLRKGLERLHGSEALARLPEFRSLYSPYATTACLYLWELAADPSWPAR